MKHLLVPGLCLPALLSFAQPVRPVPDTNLLQPVEIRSVRAAADAPVAKTDLTRADLAPYNTGRDLPFLLDQTPSVQVNSDAGNGIGYTGFRIRGTDPTRINITLNGIPFNDAESQGAFLVNIPDFASSAGSVQVQRGVGTSTHGAGSFGGSVNLYTNQLETERYLQVSQSYGSYQSMKTTLMAHSGLLRNRFLFQGRVSRIASNGYVDRATTRLLSFFTGATYVDGKQSLRLNVFSGKEKTYAAWFGINQATLDTNRRFNPAGTERPGSPYENETDNYRQTHLQLFYNRTLRPALTLSVTGFLTFGRGYFEQYKADQSLRTYGLPPFIDGADTLTSTDLVRQLWLDNRYYGSLFSLQYRKNRHDVIAGGQISGYDGRHFGELVYSAVRGAIPPGYRWYDLDAFKYEASAYVKWTRRGAGGWQTYLDLQGRRVWYDIDGFRNNPDIRVRARYFFFNPKAGISYQSDSGRAYLSYGASTREPNRDDFEAGLGEQPRPETLHDVETGYEHRFRKGQVAVNLYYMYYRNQLVLTGKVNDVFAYTRTNIPHSFRSGLELSGQFQAHHRLRFSGNLTYSINRIRAFTEYQDDYDNGGQVAVPHRHTDIAFSPRWLGALQTHLTMSRRMSALFSSKYVGRQFLDNTGQRARSMPGYFVQDVRLAYRLPVRKGRTMEWFVQGFNLFSARYVANGYTFSYVSGGAENTENYFYPMAPFNVMAGLQLQL